MGGCLFFWALLVSTIISPWGLLLALVCGWIAIYGFCRLGTVCIFEGALADPDFYERVRLASGWRYEMPPYVAHQFLTQRDEFCSPHNNVIALDIDARAMSVRRFRK